MRVVDAGNYSAASEIDLFRLSTSESPYLVRFAGGNNAFTANGKGLHVWMRDIAGKDFPVKQNPIRNEFAHTQESQPPLRRGKP